MKTFDKKDVFSWTNTESAKKYVEQQGYFGNSFPELEKHINDDETAILVCICESGNVNCIFKTERNIRYGLFIPKDRVKEIKKEKKWRPFKDIEEFNKVIPMGTVFKFRYKSNDAKDVYSIYYHANLNCENGFQAIFFEDSYHHFDYCFYEMLLFLNGRWQPFGVLDEN